MRNQNSWVKPRIRCTCVICETHGDGNRYVCLPQVLRLLRALLVCCLRTTFVLAPLKRGAVIAARIVRGLRCPAQGGTVLILISLDPVTILDGCKSGLDIIKLGRIQDVLIASREGCDLLLRFVHTVGGWRMSTEHLGDRARLPFLFSFDLLEECGKCFRVVSGL